jgi:hypothetical protein
MVSTRLAFLSISWLGVAVSAFAGPYSTYNGVGSNAVDQPIAASDSRFTEWALDTNHIYSPAPGVGPNYQNPAGFMSLGDLYNPSSPPATGKTPDYHMGTRSSQNLYPFNGNLSDLADSYGFAGIDTPGSITVTFNKAICNGNGPDFAVFENGFYFTYPWAGFFAELAYVEVSSNGVDFARFNNVSLNTGYGPNKGFDMSNVYNLAGKNEKGLGTPFDLVDLATNPLVTAGLLDLNNIEYVRLVDIPGFGYFQDNAASVVDPTTGLFYLANHSVYDAPFTEDAAGFDFRFVANPSTGDTASVGVLNAVPEPGSLALLVAATLGCIVFAWRRRLGFRR